MSNFIQKYFQPNLTADQRLLKQFIEKKYIPEDQFKKILNEQIYLGNLQNLRQDQVVQLLTILVNTLILYWSSSNSEAIIKLLKKFEKITRKTIKDQKKADLILTLLSRTTQVLQRNNEIKQEQQNTKKQLTKVKGRFKSACQQYQILQKQISNKLKNEQAKNQQIINLNMEVKFMKQELFKNEAQYKQIVQKFKQQQKIYLQKQKQLQKRQKQLQTISILTEQDDSYQLKKKIRQIEKQFGLKQDNLKKQIQILKSLNKEIKQKKSTERFKLFEKLKNDLKESNQQKGKLQQQKNNLQLRLIQITNLLEKTDTQNIQAVKQLKMQYDSIKVQLKIFYSLMTTQLIGSQSIKQNILKNQEQLKNIEQMTRNLKQMVLNNEIQIKNTKNTNKQLSIQTQSLKKQVNQLNQKYQILKEQIKQTKDQMRNKTAVNAKNIKKQAKQRKKYVQIMKGQLKKIYNKNKSMQQQNSLQNRIIYSNLKRSNVDLTEKISQTSKKIKLEQRQIQKQIKQLQQYATINQSRFDPILRYKLMKNQTTNTINKLM